MAPDVNALTYNSVGLNDLRRVAEEIVSCAGNTNVWLFHGEMGAGKTTLIKVIGKVLGIQDSITSPTFSIVNEYQVNTQKKVFHFDFYRIKNEEEAYDIGTEEYFYSGHYCFVEWSEKIPGLIPERRADITITIKDNTHRTIAVSVS
jgi:tRNA threonylcarbamoyladenosine biosynthesis protein TsaE